MYDDAVRYMTSASAPYPPVAVKEKNPFYAALLAEDLAGERGELTAIHQYVYQSWLLAPHSRDAARALRNVARVEMLHLDILGEIVTLLGCTPKFGVVENGCRLYWNGEMPSYEKNPAEMMKQNVRLEKAAIGAYGAHTAQIQDVRVQTMLRRLILDEELHLQLFKRLCADFS